MSKRSSKSKARTESQQRPSPSSNKLPKKKKNNTNNRVLRTAASAIKTFGIFSLVLTVVLAIILYSPPPVGEEESVQGLLRRVALRAFYIGWEISDWLGYGSFVMNIETLRIKDMPLEDLPSTSRGGVKTSRIYIENVPVLVHRPIGLDSNAPAVVVTNGGGFLLFSVDVYDLTMYTISTRANVVSFSVQMRKPPAHPFPAGVNDCIAVTRHLLKHGDKYGVDSTRVGMIGDSSGGVLASATAWNISQEASKGLFPPMKFVVLHYPLLQAFHMLTPSRTDYYDILDLCTSKTISEFFALYAGIALKDAEKAAKPIRENRHVPPEMLKNSKYAKYVDYNNLPERFRSPKKPIPEFKEPFDAEISSILLDKLTDPNFTPFMADDLSAFPETFMYALEVDYVRDDALLFHKRLQDAGVKSQLKIDKEGAYHGNFVMHAYDFLNLPSIEKSLNMSINFIKRVVGSDRD